MCTICPSIFFKFFKCIAHSKGILTSAIYIISIVVEEAKVLTMYVANTSNHTELGNGTYVCVCLYVCVSVNKGKLRENCHLKGSLAQIMRERLF